MRSQTQINDRSDPVSVRTSLSTRGEISRRRFKEQEHEHIVQTPDPILFPQRSHASLSISEVVPERSMLPSAMRNLSLGGRPAYSSSGSQSRPVSYSECRDDYRLFNMERITEVLQSLERFDQDGDLRYEQLMLLESNLFLEGFSFNDQHRDMRMDIDNMTYEDLLALEEKMGSVSTALPEEAFSKCLKRSTFRTCYPLPGISRHNDDDVKCSICQEEYVLGEEVGRLQCKHTYHVECIHQWLRLKNWCPICKAPAILS
ncbi:hypothetical protein HPP92_010237 [Vanilla planifolia]|uniref:RING-type E3 ubiquitin transferase n=1 Tax=Vanilla planifolia TaxID=51239 RepID=A0A835QTP8_VANPL|nr:hypothetical protein HPP92_010324 [Vanilla planifolia]KAG0482153.1 hypothetical protein HPP92_010237 [Vanilla planifolia]